MFGNYTFFNLLEKYVSSHKKRENFKDDSDTVIVNDYFGLTYSLFMLLLLIAFIFWFAALYLLIKNWNSLEVWAQIVGVLGLFTGIGPIVTIIVVFIGRKRYMNSYKSIKYKSRRR
jgi:Fe2+ transport system protein B